MASNPPGPCCVVGVKHEGTPAGSMIKIGQRDAYLATPEKPNGAAIVFLPDVFGIWQNSQILADQYAANGYLTVVPDLFNGDQLHLDALNPDSGFDVMGWIGKGSSGDNPHTPEAVDPIVVDTINWVKTEKKITKIGASGYCFGAKFVARHISQGLGAGFFAHPSFVSDDELKAFNAPLSIAASEVDGIFPAELRRKSEDILQQKGDPYQICLYSGTEHGFAVRGAVDTKPKKFAKEQSFLQAINWFNNWLF